MGGHHPWETIDVEPGLKWERVKTLWPKRSFLSEQKIPMYSTAYHLCDKQAGLETDMWLTEEEFIFERLKGNI